MKILTSAILFSSLFAGQTAYSRDYDLATMTTTNGNVYREVLFLNADASGLLFRHANGIAKESYPFLSTNIRDMFEPVAEIPAASEINLVDGLEINDPVTPELAKEKQTVVFIPDMTLTLIIRKPACPQMAAFCQMHPNPANWPSHWHRFHPAHYLTNPICRAAATRNFLETTGLLPQPWGGGFIPSGVPRPIRFW